MTLVEENDKFMEEMLSVIEQAKYESKQNTQLKESNMKLRDNVSRAKDELIQSEKVVSALRDEIESLKIRVDNCKKQHETVSLSEERLQFSLLSSENINLKNSVSELEKQLSMVNAKKETLENALSATKSSSSLALRRVNDFKLQLNLTMSKQDDLEQTIEKLKSHYSLIESGSHKFKSITSNLCQTLEEKEAEIKSLQKELVDLKSEVTVAKVNLDSEKQDSPKPYPNGEDTLLSYLQVRIEYFSEFLTMQLLQEDVSQIKEKLKNEVNQYQEVMKENYRLKEELIISKQAEIDLSFQLFSAKDREALIRDQCASQLLEKDDTISGMKYEIMNLKRVIGRMEMELKESKSEGI